MIHLRRYRKTCFNLNWADGQSPRISVQFIAPVLESFVTQSAIWFNLGNNYQGPLNKSLVDQVFMGS